MPAVTVIPNEDNCFWRGPVLIYFLIKLWSTIGNTALIFLFNL